MEQTREARSPIAAASDFDEVFAIHWPRLCRVLSRITGNPEEAQDLALEAFWRLHRDRGRLLHVPGVSAWLYRVAVNLAFNAIRSRKRRQAYEAKAVQTESRVFETPGTQLEKQDRQRLVRKALGLLKDRSAQILILRYDGWSYAEIAAALGIQPGSVGTLLARAEKEFEAQYRKLERKTQI